MDREIFTYKGAKRLIALTALLTIGQGICTIFQAILLADLVSGLFAGRPVSAIGSEALLFLGVLVCRYFFVFLIKHFSYRFAERTSSDMRKKFLAKLFELGHGFIRGQGTGNLVTLTLEGAAQVRQYLELFIPKMAANGILPLMILIYVFTEDRMSALILLLTMPVLIIFLILLGLAAQKKMDDRWASYRVLSNHFIDSLRGLSTLCYLGLGKRHQQSIERVSDKYRVMTMKTLRLAFLSSFALDFFTMLSIAFVAVSLGLRLIDGHILLDPALIVLILAPEYFLPIRELGQDYHATLDGKEAAHKLNALASRPEKERPQTDLIPETWSDHSVLALEESSVCYREGKKEKALDAITFTTVGFEKFGIIGTSGAGKSTLIDLIGGFLAPASGLIKINGRTADLTDPRWRKLITYIPQHPYLFSASLKENIAFYAPEATDRQIVGAVRSAGLETLISQFPQGLDEKIGAGGRQLSGGQEQRVALARAFLCNRPILLLDEPTAHLDIETEYDLKEAMIRLFKGKLVFLATHRLHWMDQMDRIAVIQQGRLAEVGTQEELLKKNGSYCSLVRSQLEGIQ
ncbi:thiol reductant ABC exporter subunit CydD [Sporolactobacillus sp. KGMB 08714]|uniref:thiol reductant ABC exporter subunit CydD n=1 Tax=Sporolactobacillus sp. KGMB 08714 TaxID=3064704 RepID=UPI002FBDDA06